MLLGSFVVMFIFSATSEKLIQTFPNPDCTALDGHDDPAIMQYEAILEHRSNWEKHEKGLDVSFGRYVQCFCEERAI